MVTVGRLLGAKDKDRVIKEMNKVLDFEKKLAKIYEPKEQLRNTEKTYNKMTIADLQQIAPSVRSFSPSLSLHPSIHPSDCLSARPSV